MVVLILRAAIFLGCATPATTTKTNSILGIILRIDIKGGKNS
jgi:hypothetical protein